MGIMSRISGLADTAGFGNLSKAFAEEAMNSARMSQTVCDNIMVNGAKNVINKALSHVDDFGDDFAAAARKVLDSKNVDDIADFMNKNYDTLRQASINGKDEAFKTAMDTYTKHVGIIDEKGYGMEGARALLGRTDKQAGLGIKGTLSGFYGDAEYGSTRLKATIAGAAGVAVGGRLLSGGSLTTNARGEHDIAGIPFI